MITHSMQNIDPDRLFPGTILIIAPHMDDEALACGGLIARLPQKDRIHILYATDGMKSPSPVIPGRDKITADLGTVRVAEATEAMEQLGVHGQNLHYLCLPEAQLQKNAPSLKKLLGETIKRIAPDHIFIPFRYDRHPDHLAVNHAVFSELQKAEKPAQVVEYFVYYRWRLLPKQRIQKYIKPQFLFRLDISDVAQQKRQALDCYRSQTTLYYPWQTRAILTHTLLDEECQNPELFLIAGRSVSGAAVFSNSVLWIRLAHRLEPYLVKLKYLSGAYLKRMFRRSVR